MLSLYNNEKNDNLFCILEHVTQGFRLEKVMVNLRLTSLSLVIAIFKQLFTNEDFLAEALRILKPNCLLVIREPLPNRKPGTAHLYSDIRISSLKLSGFKVKDTDLKDFDLESTNLLLKVYSDIKEVGTVSTSKPSFESVRQRASKKRARTVHVDSQKN
ncbi:uncharacterized protein LOC112464449 [Temnothorax curvispinosus]|uniref:Uncharacterized protein LOC112464449 n=1 Tax=Temnothorax curvispinosus TaxID=300111 RepID=A0A6J1R326_9HYME|nr:uncharacterized protein LOC112464449 [Temnothorax curvispinosus]